MDYTLSHDWSHDWPHPQAGRVQLYDIGSGDLLQDVQAHSGAVWSVDVHPDRHGVATGSADHNIKFWDFELVSDPDSTK